MDRTDAATVGVPEMPGPLTDDALVRRIIDAASAAPSIHNTQPWRFRLAGPDLIEVHADPDRMLWVADPHGRALLISCGPRCSISGWPSATAATGPWSGRCRP